MQSQTACSGGDDEALIRKAAIASADTLGLNLTELGQVVGTGQDTLAREAARLDEKQAELALLVIQVARDLSVLTSGERANMRHWIATHNDHLGGMPKELMMSADGLVRVVDYLQGLESRENG